MSTSLYESIIRLESRWQEAERLINIASRHKRAEKKTLLNGVSIVLQTAHFEASLKELSEAIVEDINTYSTSSLISESARKNYLRNLFSNGDIKLNSKEGQDGIQKILDWVYRDSLKLDKKRFSDTESNPKPEVIKKLLKQFGVSDFFITISTTDLEFWISTNDSNDYKGEIKRIYKHLKKSTRAFPYTVESNEMTLDYNPKAQKESSVALLSNLNLSLKHRNMVAHSGIMEENVSYTDVAMAEIT